MSEVGILPNAVNTDYFIQTSHFNDLDSMHRRAFKWRLKLPCTISSILHEKKKVFLGSEWKAQNRLFWQCQEKTYSSILSISFAVSNFHNRVYATPTTVNLDAGKESEQESYLKLHQKTHINSMHCEQLPCDYWQIRSVLYLLYIISLQDHLIFQTP